MSGPDHVSILAEIGTVFVLRNLVGYILMFILKHTIMLPSSVVTAGHVQQHGCT